MKNELIKITCIIPAYNEGARIGDVLRVASEHPLIDEIIVVDDGSIDDTKNVIAAFEKVKLVVHPHNRGKSAAVHSGITESKGEFLLFLDADLMGLNTDNITKLITPVLNGGAQMSISLRGNTPLPWKLLGLDFISGERVLPHKVIARYYDNLLSLRGFGLEVFFNDVIIRNRLKIKVVKWPNVGSPYSKYGGWWKTIIYMNREVMRSASLPRIVYQIIMMLWLKI